MIFTLICLEIIMVLQISFHFDYLISMQLLHERIMMYNLLPETIKRKEF